MDPTYGGEHEITPHKGQKKNYKKNKKSTFRVWN